MYNILFDDTISNIPLTIGVTFHVFLRTDEHLQDLDIQCGQ